MFVIRSFDINVPGTPHDKLRGGVLGGSILQGILREGDEIEILPGYLEKKDGKIIHEPLYTEVLSLHSQNLRLKEAKSGGLIGVQTDLDPALTKADSLVGNVAGKPGTLPSVLYDFDMDAHLFKYVVGTDETVPVERIAGNELLRLNVGSSVTLATVTGIRGDVVHVGLMKPVAAGPGWKAAIARRVGGKWRLIGVGKIMG
jgi:translation initiation factor 2 subunit 3